MNVAIATLLSSKHFKISSMNFNRACLVLDPYLKPNFEDDNILFCGVIVTESTIKNIFINFTDDWQDGYWQIVCNVEFICILLNIGEIFALLND